MFVTLVCGDKTEFELDRPAATYIGVVKDMLECVLVAPGQSQPYTIPVPNVSGTIMRKVLEYVDRHKTDGPLPPDYEDRIRDTDAELDEWDGAFVKVDQATLFSIMSAANYLNIKTLLDITCRTVAGMIQGKSADELRAFFGAADDLTESEKAAIEKENEWLIKDV